MKREPSGHPQLWMATLLLLYILVKYNENNYLHKQKYASSGSKYLSFYVIKYTKLEILTKLNKNT